ncbi:MAG TPA: extensin family protein [Polyangiaceae bacterium]
MKLGLALFVALAAPLFAGCAHDAPEVSYPRANDGGWVVPASYQWPPASVAAASLSNSLSVRAAKSPPPMGAPPTSRNPKPISSVVPRPRARSELRGVLPGSSACLSALAERGVPFHTLEHEIGVKTPIVVDGPIAGIRFYSSGTGPLVADCRLVLALDRVAPELVAYGVSAVRFSGAYVYRLSNKGRVSLHAYGLAIDLHGFTRFGTNYEVEHDFRKHLEGACSPDAPAANGFACRLHGSGLFHEFLTPDDNADHHDHVHVGVSPLPEEVE